MRTNWQWVGLLGVALTVVACGQDAAVTSAESEIESESEREIESEIESDT